MDTGMFIVRTRLTLSTGLFACLIILGSGPILEAGEMQWVGQVTIKLEGKGSAKGGKKVGSRESHSTYEEKKDAWCQIRACGDEGPLRVLDIERSASWSRKETSTGQQDHRVCDDYELRTRETIRPGDSNKSNDTWMAWLEECQGQPNCNPATVFLSPYTDGKFVLGARYDFIWATKLDNVSAKYDSCSGRTTTTELHYAPGLAISMPETGSADSGSNTILTGPSVPLPESLYLLGTEVQGGDTLKGSKLIYSQSSQNGKYQETLTASWDFKRAEDCECAAFIESYSGDVRIDGKPIESMVITSPVEITTGRKSRIAIEHGENARVMLGSNTTHKLEPPCSEKWNRPPKGDRVELMMILSSVGVLKIIALIDADHRWMGLTCASAGGVRGRLLPKPRQDGLRFASLSYPGVNIMSDMAGDSVSPGVHQLKHLVQGQTWPYDYTGNHSGSLLTSFTDQTFAQLEAGLGEADLQELLPSNDELNSSMAAAIVVIDPQRGSTIWVLKGAVEVMAHDSKTSILQAPGGLADGVLPSPYHFDAKQLKIRAKQSGAQDVRSPLEG